MKRILLIPPQTRSPLLWRTASIAASLVIAFTSVIRGRAQPLSANSISFQGALKGSDGKALPDANYNLTFRFWDGPFPTGQPVSTNILVPSVPLNGGVASTAIPVDPAWFTGQIRYLSISINGGLELSPRVMITAMPYALTTQTLGGGRVSVGTNGNIGVGTVNPAATLHVAGSGFFGPDAGPLGMNSGPGVRIFSQPSVGGEIYAYNYSTGPFGTPLNLILQSAGGNVGIGTVNPAAKLHVAGSGFFGPDAGPLETNSGPGVRIFSQPSVGGEIYAYNYSTGPFGTPLNLILQSTGGNVGIGTDNPQAKLDIDGTTRTKVLQITGGADLAEHLNVSNGNPKSEFSVEPGMVVSIDPTGNRKFKLSDEPYDRNRVGIISGGNGVKPGLVLHDEGNPQADGDQPISLTGQVWCHADATSGPISPGDLLTTSGTPGHAMKVTDDAKARFAVLGQALTGLKEGRGWVQVLVGKQ